MTRTADWLDFTDAFELYLMGGLLVGAVAIKLRYLLEVLGHAARPAALTYTEGVNAVLATRPELWYQPLGTAPHFPTIYPPLYHLLVGALAKLPFLNAFTAMHAIGLLSGLAGAAALYTIARNLGGSRHAGLIAGGAYWLSPIVTGATVLGRVDHLGIALGLWAIWAATRGGRGDPWVAGALTVASMYVKHSLIVFPIAIAAWYWWRGYRRDAVAYAGFVAATGLAILAVLVWLTDGQAWLHLVGLNTNQQFYPLNALNLTGWFLAIHASMMVLIAVAVVYTRRIESTVAFIALAMLTGLALAAKIGAWSGYFLPAIAATALTFGLFADRYLDGSTFRWLVIGLLLVTQAGQYAAMQPQPEYDADAQAAVAKLVAEADGSVLAVDNGLLVTAGKAEVYEPQLLKPAAGVPDRARLVGRIEAEAFALIVIRVNPYADSSNTRWTAAQLRAVREHYALVERHGEYRVYAAA